MDIFATYKTDETLELQGVWQKIGGSKFKIARLGNAAYVAALTSRFEEHAQALEAKGPAADTLSQKLMVETWAETILLDWGDDIEFDGVVTPYSKDAARTALAVKDFRIAVLALADKLANYQAAREEAAAKN